MRIGKRWASAADHADESRKFYFAMKKLIVLA
jgi:hypothetical protein